MLRTLRHRSGAMVVFGSIALVAAGCVEPPCAGYSRSVEVCRAGASHTSLATFEIDALPTSLELAVTNDGVVFLDNAGTLVTVDDAGTVTERLLRPNGVVRSGLSAVDALAYFVETTSSGNATLHSFDLATNGDTVLLSLPVSSPTYRALTAVDAETVFVSVCAPFCSLTRLDLDSGASESVPVPVGAVRGPIQLTATHVVLARATKSELSFERWTRDTLAIDTSFRHPSGPGDTASRSGAFSFRVGSRLVYAIETLSSGSEDSHTFSLDLYTGEFAEPVVPPGTRVTAIVGDERGYYLFGYPHWRASTICAAVDADLAFRSNAIFFNGEGTYWTSSMTKFAPARNAIYFTTSSTRCRYGGSCSGADILTTLVLHRVVP